MTSPRDAEAVAAEFKDYAYSVSHDLSAPVRAMVEFSHILSTEHTAGLSANAKEYLSIIIDNGKKLQAMMDGLLAYSRLNTAARPFAMVDCNYVLAESVSALASKIKAAGAEINIAHLPSFSGDETQLVQLFTVLLDNALTYRRRDSALQISVSAERVGEQWKITVADNGIGIAARHQQRIFRFFQRLHTDEEYPGVGMGLALAHKIMQRHCGDIACVPDYSPGAAFYVLFPAIANTGQG